jgi:hypothetical protein
MKKTFIFLTACMISMLASAQIFQVTSVQELPGASYEDARVAGISPAGDYVLMTTGSYIGLTRVDLATNQVKNLSKKQGAGYNPVIDGEVVKFYEAKIEADLSFSYNYVQADMSANTKKTIAKKQAARTLSISENAVSLINEECQMFIVKNGKKIQIAPQGNDVNYIWASLSPDKTKILYFVSEMGCHVCNIDGSKSQLIGYDCGAPQWYDNNTIIAMNDQDDGTYTVASSIVAYTLDGKYQVLTSPDMIAMYPFTANGKVVFSTVEGKTYVMNIK